MRSQHGVLLIFDEVITGFRWSRGGAQARYAITPDLCILAKILAGGLPGGAVAGRAEILDQLDAGAAQAAKREKIGHQGTFNANPLCAAAGVATLTIVEEEEVCVHAERTAAELRAGLRAILVDEQIPWGIYGEASAFLIFPNPKRLAIDPARFDPLQLGFEGLKGARNPELCLPPAAGHARQWRRHHGRAGRPGLRRARAERCGPHAGRPFAPRCAGSRPKAIFRSA